MQPSPHSRVQVTISRLPTSLSIVSIPRSRLDALSHPVLHLLLQPSSTFFSVTANLIELSLFADAGHVSALEEIARADQASSSSSSVEPVQVSDERWSVLQIDSHSDQLDDAGARVSELSAPLAQAGISILYQSSYMSDFIFVKERRLAQVMSLFAAAGFVALHAADPNLLTTSLAPFVVGPTRERSGSAPLPSTNSRSSSKSGPKGALRASSTGQTREATQPSNQKSGLSVPLPDVRVLAPDLACVGLADDAAEQWQLKLVKLLAFPDLIPIPARAAALSSSSKSASQDDGYFSHSPSPTPEDKPDECGSGVPRSPPLEVPSRLDPLPVHISWPEPVSEEPKALADTSVEHTIPFFSFTRTPEGSSLTAGASVLAALFPRAERHMVICGGELDAADRQMEESPMSSVPSSPIVANGHGAGFGHSGDAEDEDEDEDEDDEDADGHPLLSALQIDLRSADLNTHGLVHRFSRALARGAVNHMYASTLRTANLLVPTGRNGRSARRASGLLQDC